MMKNCSLIVAIGKNNEIGKDNQLIWHFTEDLKFFKKMTMNKTIIMGRKTFESLPNILPNRKHIILTKNKNYQINNILVMHSKKEVIDYIKSTEEECFIIGGESIYKEFLPECYTLYITEIDKTYSADTFFPKFNKHLYHKKIIGTNEEKGVKYSFVKYQKGL